MSDKINQALAPEDQVKTITLSYPEFCLLLGALSDAIHECQEFLRRVEASGSWESKATPGVAAERVKLSNLKSFLARLTGDQG
jgi:hypothetical protein